MENLDMLYIIGHMLNAEIGVALKSSQELKSPVNILESASYALRWNTPERANQIQAGLQQRISALTASSYEGSPTDRAETRHILAKARQETVRLRRLGLASGRSGEHSSGMIFGVPRSNPDQTTRFPDFRDPASFEWWYLPHQRVEKTFSPALKVDQYVSRAAQELIALNEPPVEASPTGLLRIDLDPVASASLLRTARYMKDNGLHGIIPTRREIIINDIIHSEGFSSSNISQLPSRTESAVTQPAAASA